MIKINLLRALKESPSTENSTGEGGGGPFSLKGLLAKLVPQKREAGDFEESEIEVGPTNTTAVVLKLVMIFGAVGGLKYHETINIPKLQTELADQSQKLEELTNYNNKASAAVAEIKKLQELKALIEKQIDSLDGLSKVRVKYVRALDLIQSNLPDKMWFVGLKSNDNVLEINGISMSETEISQFLDVMGRSVYFSDVSMLSSEDLGQKDGDGKKLKRFTLNFVLEGGK